MKIGLITPGGDAPGMNAAIRSVVRVGSICGFEITGIRLGFSGLLNEDFISLDRRSVGGIINIGGTILKSSRCDEIRTPKGVKKAAKILTQHLFDYLVIIGGDGTFNAGCKISKASGVPVIGIPATIDNDIFGTDETVGFDTAIDTAIEAIDKIRDTATSFERVFIVEVMGREHGFLAVNIAIASGAEFVLIPEIKYNLNEIAGKIKKMKQAGKKSLIIIFAEGAGNSAEAAKILEFKTGFPVRVSNLGYIQRGGSPSARSRILGTQFGSYAVDLIRKKAKNRAVVIRNCAINDIDIERVISNNKKVDRHLLDILEKVAI
ncbi:MAG: ATP-dependent 6-phosphofructokinase [Elusimicrobia bacterium RIFOXYB2_FULL_48_7]|nr:MAG: ATP-dependent 6-phosphofructokinase [Elusimicrobia bacterium RIFOXYB2_FULL_48_7]